MRVTWWPVVGVGDGVGDSPDYRMIWHGMVNEQLVIVAGAMCFIVLSGYYIVLMAPYRVVRNDWLGWMSQYTAVGALGIILGVYLVVVVIQLYLSRCQ